MVKLMRKVGLENCGQAHTCRTGTDDRKLLKRMAGTTGLEPATSDVTGRRSNQLNYVPAKVSRRYSNPNTAGARTPNRRRKKPQSLAPEPC